MPELISFIQSVGPLGYVVFFLIIFLESFPVTFLLPGDSLLFTAGFLSFSGIFNFPILVTCFFVASVLGYIGSYYFGKYLGKRIFSNEESFWFNPKHLERTKRFYDKYGTKTIILGRFIPIVRSFGPALAGAIEMNFKKFIKYDFIGGIFWACGVTSLGFYLGKMFPTAHLYLTPIVIMIIIASITPGAVEYFLEKRNKK